MRETSRGLILIADIGGYTRFMSLVELIHARMIMSALLESMLDTVRPPFEVAKLEGDAVFCYALDQGDSKGLCQASLPQIFNIFERFHQRLDMLPGMEPACNCHCGACTSIGEMTLKFIIHFGEIGFHRIRQFTELIGRDVIVAHRLLKNHVELREYVLATQDFLNILEDTERFRCRLRQEHYDHIGEVPIGIYELSRPQTV